MEETSVENIHLEHFVDTTNQGGATAADQIEGGLYKKYKLMG